MVFFDLQAGLKLALWYAELQRNLDRVMRGRVWKFGDSIETDAINPYYRYPSMEELKKHTMEVYRPEFPHEAKPGDIIVVPQGDAHVLSSPAGLRAEVDERTESIGRKIREAELQKTPYMMVVGDREAEGDQVALRRHGEGDLGTLALDEAIGRLKEEAA